MKFPLNLRGLPKDTVHLYSRWIQAEEHNLRLQGGKTLKERLEFHDKCDRLCKSIVKTIGV